MAEKQNHPLQKPISIERKKIFLIGIRFARYFLWISNFSRCEFCFLNFCFHAITTFLFGNLKALIRTWSSWMVNNMNQVRNCATNLIHFECFLLCYRPIFFLYQTYKSYFTLTQYKPITFINIFGRNFLLFYVIFHKIIGRMLLLVLMFLSGVLRIHLAILSLCLIQMMAKIKKSSWRKSQHLKCFCPSNI